MPPPIPAPPSTRLRPSPLLAFALRRLLQAVPVALAILAVNFLLLQAVPGDLVDVIAGESGAATPEYLDHLRRQFGLDVPAWERFVNYALGVLTLDLGHSFRHGMPIAQLILARLPATLLLLLTSIAVALLLGLLLGTLAARSRGGVVDTVVSVGSSVVFALPLFWIGLMGIVLFAVKLGWLPVGGIATIGRAPAGPLAAAADTARHLVLPAATLSLFFLALYARVTRAAVLEIQDLDFVRTARAKGIGEGRVAVRHVLRNALLPVVTLTGLKLGAILSGSIVIETVFSWPGLGRLAFEAMGARDVNLLLGIFLCSALLVIVMNLVVDLLYALLDPRIEVHR